MHDPREAMTVGCKSASLTGLTGGAAGCQTSKPRVRARLDIRTERLAHTYVVVAVIPDPRAARSLRFSLYRSR